MRVGTVFGHKIFLTDIIYKDLLNRFNTKKFIQKNNKFVNQDNCPLCNKYSCEKCPANIYDSPGGGGCFELLGKIVVPRGGKVYCNLIDLKYTNSKGKKQIDKVHSFLLKNFKKWRAKE